MFFSQLFLLLLSHPPLPPVSTPSPSLADIYATSSSKLVENYSKPNVANFGRSLFGGYCPTYVPDFVLQGIPSDDKLRQNLTAELNHAVQVEHIAKRAFAATTGSSVTYDLKVPTYTMWLKGGHNQTCWWIE